MVVYQPAEQDDFLAGFRGEDLQHSGKADFYVSPSGDVLPGEYESWIGENQRSTILSQIEDPTLKSVVGQMYPKNSVIGTGSLPEQIYFAKATSLMIVDMPQFRRAEHICKYMEKVLQNRLPSASDREVIAKIVPMWNNMLGDMQNG